MIRYADTSKDVCADDLHGGFFEHRPNPPSPETHLRVIENSDEAILALDGSDVVGTNPTTTDGVLCAYTPLLEVLPGHRNRGTGDELLRRMLAKLDDLYVVDPICDPQAQPFYDPPGMSPATGMTPRRCENRTGRETPGAIY